MLGARTVLGTARRLATSAGVPLGEGMRSVDPEQLVAERPQAVFVPFLVIASLIDVGIGLVWLAIVGLHVALAVVLVLALGWFPAMRWWCHSLG